MRNDRLPLSFALTMVGNDDKWKDVSKKSINNRYHEALRRRDAMFEQNRASTIGFIKLMGDLPGRPIEMRIERANASEKPDPDLELFLRKLAELSAT
jgi:hypothetical protein